MTTMTRYYDRFKVDIQPGVNGRWIVERFEIKNDPIANLSFELEGRGVLPGIYTRLVRYPEGHEYQPEEMGGRMLKPGGVIVMSDTPAEINDHLFIMNEVKHYGGRILIHGLGMGMFLKFCLEQENVTHVDVVEIDQDLINLVGPHYTNPKLTIHHGNCFTYKWEPGTKWDVVWHDIWDTLSLDNLKEMALLHRKFGGRCKSQDSWSKSWLKSHYRNY